MRVETSCLGVSNLLLDDNAIPHSPMATQNHIATLGWECLHPPRYSPHLAATDFHLFPALKKNLAGRRFRSNFEIKQAVKRFFCMQCPESFLGGLFETHQAV
ncbi:histone-lysine N-methyltransferase SETMAR [Trichonephila clavipes]|nr:histone-lysine N-methyltransferase SETMAR [Trichonephila clavipes]